jgi:hypothetical protein
MQPDEFARTREEEKNMKAKSPKSRCSKVDAIIGKGCPEMDIDCVIILLHWEGLIFIPWILLNSYSRKGSKLPN